MSTDRIRSNLEALENFLSQKGWHILEQRTIEHGLQVIVTDGVARLPVNLYSTGKILVQGKPGEMKNELTEWANLLYAGFAGPNNALARRNRVAKYFVIPGNIEKIYRVVKGLPGEVVDREVGGLAEVYRVEARYQGQRVTITQYDSGTLLIQGISSPYFDTVCEILDEHLAQSFAERAARFISGEKERADVTIYLETPEAENEARRWLLERIGPEVLDFLYENDKRTLLAAAGIWNAAQGRKWPEYSFVVMPFAKAFEGFMIRLAVHLGLTTENALKAKADEIAVSAWLGVIRSRLPNPKRYGEVCTALEAAWQCRHKVIHSDAFHPFSTLQSLAEAEMEVGTILRAMARAYQLFVEDNIGLMPDSSTEVHPVQTSEARFRFERVDRERLRKYLVADGYPVVECQEGMHNVWEIITPELKVVAPRKDEGVVIVLGEKAAEFCQRYEALLSGVSTVRSLARIGVDESGKGDVFGPLVVAAVALLPEVEIELARRGVRDSKALSDSRILELAHFIREKCPFEVLVLHPSEYNMAYEQHGRNLNRLLAWCHAQVISRLGRRVSALKAVSDQFGDKSLLKEALSAENCDILLEQRPHAEEDVAVAAASILARAEFVMAIRKYTKEIGIEIPLGASQDQVREVGKQVYRRWGREGLERLTKIHFKTVQEIINEVERHGWSDSYL